MTRKEAINRLKTDVYKYADFSKNPNENEFWDAFDMAIKALELEPKTDGDCISREKTCDYIAEFVNNEYSTQSECEMVDAMIEGLQHLPSVKPKEDILDKVRAEIADLCIYYDNDYFSGNRDGMFKCDEVLQTIDEYRQEG